MSTLGIAGSGQSEKKAAPLRIGLVVLDVGETIVALHIPTVARILEYPQLIHFPRPRPHVAGMLRIDEGLIPVFDVAPLVRAQGHRSHRFLVLVQDKDVTFGFGVNAVESVIQIRADRIRYPRLGEIPVDRDILRGLWSHAAGRTGLILNGAAIYTKIVETAA